tara:strand:- start:9701 stop:13078 length:3378 start_codon:yes stop_codon:yes gene_type:complete
MAFNIGLSGIDASQAQLDVTSNNIANAASIGFKKSRAEFADVYSSGVYQKVNITIGQGTKHVDVAQQFVQGSTKRTKSVLDLSIQGTGFFATAANENSKEFRYTRAGAFKLNNDNYIVNSHGDYLMSYPVDKGGNTSSLSLMSTKSVQVPTSIGEPEKSEKLDLTLNFPILKDGGDARRLDKFDPNDSDTYNFSTASVVYDSVGTQHTLKAYYIKPGVERALWNIESEKLDKNIGTAMVDCSQVFDPGGDLDNRIAWAVFYEFDGKPIQPMNLQKNDVEGFSYRAKNLVYRREGEEVPNLYASNKSGTAAATYLDIDNTKIGLGCLYPGKEASDPPEGLPIVGAIPPVYRPDNHASAPSIDKLTIISGDKNNEGRPKDFWRCQFIFMGRGGEVSKPTDPIHLQPAGFIDQVAGFDEPEVNVYGTKFKYSGFTPPRAGETALITHTLQFEIPGSLAVEVPIEIEIDDSILSLEALARKIEDVIDDFDNMKVPLLSASGTPIAAAQQPSYTDFLRDNGVAFEVDPYTAEIEVKVDESKRVDNYVLRNNTVKAEHITYGAPIVEESVVTKFTVNVDTFLEATASANTPLSSTLTEKMYVGLTIGKSFMTNVGGSNDVQALGPGKNANNQDFRNFLSTPPITAPDPVALTTPNAKLADFINQYVTALNTCLERIYHPHTIVDNSDPTQPASKNNGVVKTYSDYMEFKIGSDGRSFELHSEETLMDLDELDIKFGLYGAAAGTVLGKSAADPNIGTALAISNSVPTDPNKQSLNHLIMQIQDENNKKVLDIYAGSMAVSEAKTYVAAAKAKWPTGDGFSISFDANNVAGSTITNGAVVTPPPSQINYAMKVAEIESAEDTGSRLTLSIFDDKTQPTALNIPKGKQDLRSASILGFIADPKNLTALGPTAGGGTPPGTSSANSPWTGGGSTHPVLTTPAGTYATPDTSLLSYGEPSYTPIYMKGNSIVGENDLGADALFGIAEQDQVVRVKYGNNTMYDTPFQVIDISVDGNTVGRLTTVDVGEDGLITASFTNGSRENLGRVALARFNNEQGLLKIGNTAWEESLDSGKAIPGEGRSGTFGDITAASLEMSNVELSNELVDLIIGQRNYQANARSIEVDGTVQQTILQIR